MSRRRNASRSYRLLKYSGIGCMALIAVSFTWLGIREIQTRRAVACIRNAGGIVATMDQVVAGGKRFSSRDHSSIIKDPVCFATARWAVVKVKRSLSRRSDVRESIAVLEPKDIILLYDSPSSGAEDVLRSIDQQTQGRSMPPTTPLIEADP